MNTSKILVMFAVIAAFGLMMAAAALLPIVQQAHAAVLHPSYSCGDNPGYSNGESTHPCGGPKQR